ncbi:bile acid:sodium symporter [Fischerella thermalis CCMEE 5201]|jgi:BASS family bile acid:Na+ symporter|nr:bile acid:sodium symporter [Fischerella thermalis CCMEE 5201]
MEANFLTTVLLPTALAIIMLGMGLSLLPEDFQRVRKYPKAVSIGLISQLIILPIIGFVIAKVVPMPPTIAVGLIILALCPGGPSSNLITYLAKGDVALSVTLTAFSSIITVFTIPTFANLALQHFMGRSAAIALPISSTMLQIFLITLLPIGLGMYLRQIFPELALRLEKVTSRLAIALLVIIIIALIIREWNRLPGFILQVGIGAALLNVLSTLAGLYTSKLFKLEPAQQICIAIEVGIQNGTLAIAITAGLLNNPDMAIPAAIYSLFMNLTGFIAIHYGRKLVLSQKVKEMVKS